MFPAIQDDSRNTQDLNPKKQKKRQKVTYLVLAQGGITSHGGGGSLAGDEDPLPRQQARGEPTAGGVSSGRTYSEDSVSHCLCIYALG